VITLELSIIYQNIKEAIQNLFVWNFTKRIVGIFAFEINDKLCEFMIMTIIVYRILCLSFSIFIFENS
jgi:hypothetical protein